MKLKSYLKRGLEYVLHGKPTVRVLAQITQISPSELLKDKRIIITGGGRGLGYFMAKKCVSEGAIVVIAGRNEETLKQAIKELGEHAYYLVYDVRDYENTNRFIQEAADIMGGIDGIICNAGISLHEGNIRNVTVEGFDRQFDTNLKGGYFLVQSYIKYYETMKTEKGNIIFISSERGKQCDDIPYGLTKAAINSLVQGLSRRFYKQGIRVNAVAPGVTASDMTNVKRDDLQAKWKMASDRFFLPEEVAEVICFLLSDASNCISGEVIACDAGNHLNPWFK